jgi:hypothetical protein
MNDSRSLIRNSARSSDRLAGDQRIGLFGAPDNVLPHFD